VDIRAGHEDTARISLISSPVQWKGLLQWSHMSHDEEMHDMLFRAHAYVPGAATDPYCRACRMLCRAA
jgi:hypothetical protein